MLIMSPSPSLVASWLAYTANTLHTTHSQMESPSLDEEYVKITQTVWRQKQGASIPATRESKKGDRLARWQIYYLTDIDALVDEGHDETKEMKHKTQ